MNVAAVIKEVLSEYDLGDLIAFEKNERGFVNTSFAIETIKESQPKRLFFRQYKRGITEDELQFEHSLIDHLCSKGYPPVAEVFKTRLGKSYVVKGGPEPESSPIYYAIFAYLPGDDRYTWVETRCTIPEVARSGEVFAQFHNAVSDFIPRGRRAEPAILELLPSLDALITSWPGLSKQTAFDHRLSENATSIHQEIALVLNNLIGFSPDLPKLVIHCDYHPGNLKFQNEAVVGLFDFDWSKVDYRCFDLGLALFYFFCGWEPGENGAIRFEPLRVFMNAYQEQCRKLHCVSPLTPAEINLLPMMIRAGNLYILNWTLLDYLHKDVDVDEYLVYLNHGIQTAYWLSQPENNARLVEILAGLAE